ncbi:hypothetical protein PR048_001945 [Dryococelus australis]|uniref:Uncharacterized protein n=1 Tax=Dryococelus australis TaxID=614101 RepID=A0ABQ9IJV3_9NEOP|nr:hypothetical protein PR048_001945 [Dryococelus australis]
MEQRWNERVGERGGPRENPPDQRYRPARFPHKPGRRERSEARTWKELVRDMAAHITLAFWWHIVLLCRVAGAIEYMDCNSKYTLQSVEMSGCSTAPCQIALNTTVNVTTHFIPGKVSLVLPPATSRTACLSPGYTSTFYVHTCSLHLTTGRLHSCQRKRQYAYAEMADMHLVYGAAGGDTRASQRLYEQTFPNRRHPGHQMFTSVNRRLREIVTCTENRYDTSVIYDVRTARFEEEVLVRIVDSPSNSTRGIACTIHTHILVQLPSTVFPFELELPAEPVLH